MPRCVFFLGLVILCASSLSQAALLNLPPAVPFFRSSQSVFQSGQASRANLESSLLRTEFDHIYDATWNNKTYVLQNDQLILDIHCASSLRITENTRLFLEPKRDSPTIGQLVIDDIVSVLEIRNQWALIQPRVGAKGWLPLTRLAVRNQDLGIFVPFVDTYLRPKPTHQSSLITTISASSRLQVLKFTQDGWGEVEYNGHRGFVDLHHTISRADFASWVWTAKQGWAMISHREGSVVVTKTGERLTLANILGYGGGLQKGIVIKPTETSPPLQAHTLIRKTQMTTWGISKLDGHGEVWWKRDLTVAQPEEKKQNNILIDELLRKNLFSYALVRNLSKTQGLASAQGVWRTEDGTHWTQLPEFGDQNLPVSVLPKGAWIVGNYKSFDQGKTFEPFIRWDRLAQSIEQHLHGPPRYIRMQKIEVKPNMDIEILLDTGIRNLTVRSSISGQDWRISK